MNAANFPATKRLMIWIGLPVIGVLVLALVAWGLWPVDHTASGTSQREFTVDVGFNQFRQIMVRKRATEAIVAHSGMSLLDERMDELSIEVPRQKRPLLRAVLGKSNSELSATKQITVELNDPDVHASQLTLSQNVDIHPASMDVVSTAIEPAGNLKSYSTRLSAAEHQGGTQVKLTLSQTLELKVSRVFTAVADRRVQRAAEDSTAEQQKAILDFIHQYQADPIVLPELK